MTRADYAGSHIKLSVRRLMWARRSQGIFFLATMDIIPWPIAMALLMSLEIPNVWEPLGESAVWRHNSFRAAASTIGVQQFSNNFSLTSYQEAEDVASALQLGEIRCDGCVACGADALLVTLHRLRFEGSYENMRENRLYNYPGSRWSLSKMKSIVKGTLKRIHHLHGHRITWSGYCFNPARASVYAAAMAAKFGTPLPVFSNVPYIIDGTHRRQSRPQSVGGLDLQREYYNGWLHAHCLGFQSVMAPDGMFASLTGPFPGSRNDRQKLHLSNLVAKFTTHLPGYKILGDSGYTYNPASIILRCFPGGGNWPPTDPRKLFNDDLARVRVAVEWPFAHVKNHFRFVDQKDKMKLCTNVAVMYRSAAFLHNVLLTLGYGNRELSMSFGVQPPTLAQYLA